MCQIWDTNILTPLRLAAIAEAVGFPVVILSNENATMNVRHSTFGIDLDVDRSALAAAFHAQSAKAATVVPNLAVHPELSQWSSRLVERDLRFMVGVPLYNAEGERAGSISVVASQKAVAGKGISIALLKTLGNQFVAQAA